MVEEVWKPVLGYENYYEVSNLGRIRRSAYNNPHHNSNGLLKPSIRRGYYHVVLCVNGVHKSFNIHRLVASSFIPNPSSLPYVNHKDENKLNNSIENLEWCSARYNTNYGSNLERRGKTRRENHCGGRAIVVTDTHGNLIKRFETVTKCSKYLGTHRSNLAKIIRNNKVYKQKCINYED